MRTLPIALLALGLVLTGCQYLTPPPEVDILTVDPISRQVNQSSGGTTFDASITLKTTNNVSALLRQIQVQYYDADGEHTVASNAPALPMEVELGLGSTGPIEVTISAIPVVVSAEMITWMYANGSNAVAKIVCTGVDAYDRELEWDADINIGIYAIDL